MASCASIRTPLIFRTLVAEEFTDAYYNALDTARKTIASFYIPPVEISPTNSLPLISYNGQVIHEPREFQQIYDDEMPYTFFEIDSLNAHVINPCLTELVPTGTRSRVTPKEMEHNMSLLVQVVGTVRLYERKDGEQKTFCDNLVLVPNKVATGGKGKSKSGEGRSWLIQTQTFRFVA